MLGQFGFSPAAGPPAPPVPCFPEHRAPPQGMRLLSSHVDDNPKSRQGCDMPSSNTCRPDGSARCPARGGCRGPQQLLCQPRRRPCPEVVRWVQTNHHRMEEEFIAGLVEDVLSDDGTWQCHCRTLSSAHSAAPPEDVSKLCHTSSFQTGVTLTRLPPMTPGACHHPPQQLYKLGCQGPRPHPPPELLS